MEVCGGDKEAAQRAWNEEYKKDSGDIVKMNAALIELGEKLKVLEAMSHDA